MAAENAAITIFGSQNACGIRLEWNDGEDEVKSQKLHDYKVGVRAGAPVVLGFIPVAFAYAIAAAKVGLSIWETVLMSLSVFAGASQMMAVGMLAQDAGVFAIIFATFIINLRHFIMSTCVFNIMEPAPKGLKLLSSFWVTDESFALFTVEKEQPRSIWFYFGMVTMTYSSWVLGGLMGALAVSFLPKIISDSLGIALYAVFIALLIPSVKKNLRLALLVISTAGLNALLRLVMDGSWALIVSTLVCAAVGVFAVDLDEGPKEAEVA